MDRTVHIIYQRAKGVLLADEQAVKYYPDTGSSISLITREILENYFPNAPIHEGPHTVSLKGIGKGPQTQNFIHPYFTLTSTEGKSLFFSAEACLVDRLVYRILLSTAFLKENHIDICCAKSVYEVDRLKWKGHQFRRSCINPKKTTSGIVFRIYI
jgi:hypothetical protein